MKFLVNYSILDGEHEHYSQMVYDFENMNEAIEKTRIKKESDGIMDAEDEPMSFGDGLTCITVDSIQEITEEEYNVLHKFIRGI